MLRVFDTASASYLCHGILQHAAHIINNVNFVTIRLSGCCNIAACRLYVVALSAVASTGTARFGSISSDADADVRLADSVAAHTGSFDKLASCYSEVDFLRNA